MLDADKAMLWRAGRLRYLLHASQREAYDHYRAWEKESHEARLAGRILPGLYPRVFVCDVSRRWGKDYLGLVIRIEDALRRPKSLLTYSTALAKDVSEIVIPLVEKICEDCPPDLKPKFHSSHQGGVAGYTFHNGSRLRLVGLDRNPDGLRGRFSDGFTISEAGFVDQLQHAISSVLMPQLQGRQWATIMLNSTPPVIPGHAYDELFCPDALERSAYVTKTINDNPLLSQSERDEFIRAAGGLDSEVCLREYFCRRVRSETRVVIPEFNIETHVRASATPEYAMGFTVIDPGVADICAVISGYYDFERAKLVVRKDWGKMGANTNEVVKGLREIEAQTFSNLKYWNNTKFADNPYMRYSDVDARLIIDLNTIHGIKISPAQKDGAEAALHSLRNAIQQDKIEIHPECKDVIAHLQNAVWAPSRTSYARNEKYGHFDFVDVLKYAWRHVNKITNPFPPPGVRLQQTVNSDDLWIRDHHLTRPRKTLEALKSVLPRGWTTRRR